MNDIVVGLLVFIANGLGFMACWYLNQKWFPNEE